MIYVTRTRLDNGAPAVARATDEDLELVIDDRHITPAGASALAVALNALAPRESVEEPPEGRDPGQGPV